MKWVKVFWKRKKFFIGSFIEKGLFILNKNILMWKVWFNERLEKNFGLNGKEIKKLIIDCKKRSYM